MTPGNAANSSLQFVSVLGYGTEPDTVDVHIEWCGHWYQGRLARG